MRESSCFGVVLVRGGREVGDTSGFETIGTSARIVDFNLLEDGLLGISCRGERRFRVVRTWRQADGLNVGEVQWLDLPQSAVPPVQTVPAQYLHLADLLRRVLPELGEFYAGLEPRFEDADWVANRLLEILPISAGEKQRCLELDDPLERLALVSPLIRRAEDPEGD
jgi:Lon protease-like protein